MKNNSASPILLLFLNSDLIFFKSKEGRGEGGGVPALNFRELKPKIISLNDLSIENISFSKLLTKIISKLWI